MKVELIDHMGSDLSAVNAARVSFDKVSEQFTDKDAGLINYLAKHNHWTPFGHIFASFRIKAPIFVARQLGKHQVGLVWNEVSRRYVDDEPEFYTPDTWRSRAKNVKQGSGGDLEGNDHLNSVYAGIVGRALGNYQGLLDQGVAPEQARMVLPQSMYTEWIWSGSVAAFARVVKLRTDPHTQLETQQIAHEINDALVDLFPYSWKALTHG